MGTLEDALRDTFQERTRVQPAIPDDVAGTAIGQAARYRRRRTVAGAALTVAAIAAAALVTLPGQAPVQPAAVPSTGGPLSSSADPSPQPPRSITLPVDALNRDRIQTADGKVVLLQGIGEVNKVWRVDGGWLVRAFTGSQPASAVWFVTGTGSPILLASGDATMVSAGSSGLPGVRIAWTSGGRLSLAVLDGSHLSGIVETDGVGRLSPQAVVGDGVLLAGSQTGGGLDMWDMWFPARGTYKPATEGHDLLAALGVTLDRTQIYGLVPQKTCFGLVQPDGLTVVQATCDLNLRPEDRVYPSPTGQRWAAVGVSGVSIFESNRVWTSPTPARSEVVAATSLVWLDNISYVVATPSGQVIEYSVTGGRGNDTTMPEAGVRGEVSLVEDLR
jgi:hypothetical protein